MNEPISKGELGDDLCVWCPLPEERRGVKGVPGGFAAGCEGSKCDEAYLIYFEENE